MTSGWGMVILFNGWFAISLAFTKHMGQGLTLYFLIKRKSGLMQGMTGAVILNGTRFMDLQRLLKWGLMTILLLAVIVTSVVTRL